MIERFYYFKIEINNTIEYSYIDNFYLIIHNVFQIDLP
jgi:hypothetical protein